MYNETSLMPNTYILESALGRQSTKDESGPEEPKHRMSRVVGVVRDSLYCRPPANDVRRTGIFIEAATGEEYRKTRSTRAGEWLAAHPPYDGEGRVVKRMPGRPRCLLVI